MFKNVRISYPRYLGSTIQRLTDAGPRRLRRTRTRRRHYVSGPMATWDSQPPRARPGSVRRGLPRRPDHGPRQVRMPPAWAINPYFRNVQPSTARSSRSTSTPLHGQLRPGQRPRTATAGSGHPATRSATSSIPVRGADLHHARRHGRVRRPRRDRHGPRRRLPGIRNHHRG